MTIHSKLEDTRGYIIKNFESNVRSCHPWKSVSNDIYLPPNKLNSKVWFLHKYIFTSMAPISDVLIDNAMGGSTQRHQL